MSKQHVMPTVNKNDATFLASTKGKTQKQFFETGKIMDCLRPFYCLLLSAFGAGAMALASVFVKQLTSTSVFTILMIRFVVMLAIAAPILYCR